MFSHLATLIYQFFHSLALNLFYSLNCHCFKYYVFVNQSLLLSLILDLIIFVHSFMVINYLNSDHFFNFIEQFQKDCHGFRKQILAFCDLFCDSIINLLMKRDYQSF